MISVDARGRMGNTMFQLAFAHAASRHLQTGFIFGPTRLWEHFTLGAWGRAPVRLARKAAFRLKHGAAPADRVFVDLDRDPADVIAQLRDGVAYGGFFQSERYFSGYENEVRRLFRLRRRHEAAFAEHYSSIGPYVCVHMRRGDYLETGWALPTSYFLDALASVDHGGGREVVVVSDEPVAAREELRGLAGARFEVNPPMVDLLLLMNADVVITSNSSFSWWGAWLNRRPGARVIAPEHWFGFAAGVETPRDVIPERWVRIPVRDRPLRVPGPRRRR